MSIFDILSEYQSPELHFFHDSLTGTGLRAVVAIHDTRRGPAIGGARMFAYASEEDAVLDVVRLGRAMTAKAALAGLPHGGGKAVIWAQGPVTDRRALFSAFGRFVHTLGGRYLTCEDSGTSTSDLDVVRSVTPHCLGVSQEHGGSGDPSPFTALGVRRGIEACAAVILGKSSLTGLHVAIQGVGHVGSHLARELSAAGCRLTVADVNPERARLIAAQTGAAVTSVDEILSLPCDVLAPCALGGIISDSNIDRLRCRVVAGAANNQLGSRNIGRLLHSKGIFYAPDYAINAGGLINVAQEFQGYNADAARANTLSIYETIAEIARRSVRTQTPPSEIADRMVEEILRAQPQPQSVSNNATIFSSPSDSRPRGTAV